MWNTQHVLSSLSQDKFMHYQPTHTQAKMCFQSHKTVFILTDPVTNVGESL